MSACQRIREQRRDVQSPGDRVRPSRARREPDHDGRGERENCQPVVGRPDLRPKRRAWAPPLRIVRGLPRSAGKAVKQPLIPRHLSRISNRHDKGIYRRTRRRHR
jgi:hypothetical protein